MAIIGDVHIKVSTEVLESKSETVSKSVDNMVNCFDELERIINRTSYYWIGEAGDLHRRLYQEQKDNIEEMIKRLREHPRDLIAIAQNYQTANTRAMEIASALPGDIIE